MRKLIVIVALGIGAVLLVAVFNKNRGPNPRYLEKRKATQRFLTQNRARIEAVADKLKRVAAIDLQQVRVEAEGGKLNAPGLYLWREDLEGAEKPRLVHKYGPLASFRKLHWALSQDPAHMGTLGIPSDLERRLARMEAEPWGLIRIERFQPAKITRLPTAKERGQFTPGSVHFQLWVIDPTSGAVLAKGQSQATNSPSVEVRGSPDMLRNDLKSATEKAARALVADLARKARANPTDR